MLGGVCKAPNLCPGIAVRLRHPPTPVYISRQSDRSPGHGSPSTLKSNGGATLRRFHTTKNASDNCPTIEWARPTHEVAVCEQHTTENQRQRRAFLYVPLPGFCCFRVLFFPSESCRKLHWVSGGCRGQKPLQTVSHCFSLFQTAHGVTP